MAEPHRGRPWVAAMPMYNLPEIRAATDSWWAGIAAHCRDVGIANVPDELDHSRDAPTIWTDTALLFGQSCGYPLTHAFKDHIQAIATPCYVAAGCTGADYCSHIIARDGSPFNSISDVTDATIAVNNLQSQSGWIAPRAAAQRAFGRSNPFGDVHISGSHRKSIEAVRTGRADIAAIDAVTWALIGRYCGSEIAGLRCIGQTPNAPGLPYVTQRNMDPAIVNRLQEALLNAARDPALAPARRKLCIIDIAVLDPVEYQRVVIMADHL